MGFQCLPQVLKLVRGDGMRRDGKGKSKLQANAAAIINEAHPIRDPVDGHPIPIRKSASETYDRTRTKYNKYVGPVTADDVLEALDEEASKQKVEVRVKDKQTGETVIRQRSLPSNAVIGLAVIYNPPCDVARNWTPEQYARFIQDCEEVMAQIPCRKMDKKGHPVGEPYYLFRQENIIARAEHWDESEPGDPPIYTGHWHETCTPMDQYGKYNGNMVDSLFLSVMVNRMFPRMMRERGWDIDDPECTDWEKFNDDKTYRAKRKTKIKQGGKPVNNYRAEKKLEEAVAALEEAGAMMEQAVMLKQDVKERAEADADDLREQARADAEAVCFEAAVDAGEAVVQAETEAALDAVAALDTVRLEAAIEVSALLDGAQAEADTLRETAQADAAKVETEKKQAEAARDRAQRETADTVAAKLAAEADRDTARKEAADAQERQMIAQMALAPLADTKAGIQGEIRSLGRSLASTRKDVETAKAEAKAAKADRDAARREADELRRNAVERAEQAAKQTQAQLEAEAREYWKNWLADKKKKAETAAAKIIEDARTKAADIIAVAAEAAKDEYAYFIKWMSAPHRKYTSGKHKGRTFLEAARADRQEEIRQKRAAMVRGARKEQLPEYGAPEK